MRKCHFLLLWLFAAAATSSASAQTQAEFEQEISRMSDQLGEVWNKDLKSAISKYAGAEAAACVADVGLKVTAETETVPAIGLGLDRMIRIPLYYIQFQLSAVQAPAFYVLGVPEATDLPKLFEVQEAIFDDLRRAVADQAVHPDRSIRVESVFGRMGMTAERYGALNAGFANSPAAMAIGNAFGFAYEFVLLHEAGHAIDLCGELGAFTDSRDPELRADDFAFAMLAKETIPVVFSLEPLRTIAAFESGDTNSPTGALAACRLARAVVYPGEVDVSTIPGLQASGGEATRFRMRMGELLDFYRNRYAIALCDGFR